MIENLIVEEVHQIRQAMLTKHSGDLHALVQEAEGFNIDPSLVEQPFVIEDAGDDWNGSFVNSIVEEIHSIRAEMLAEHGGDIKAMMEDMDRRKKPVAASRTVVELPPRDSIESASGNR